MVKAEYSGIVTPRGEYSLTLYASAFADNAAAKLDVKIVTKGQGQLVFGPGVKKLASAAALVDGAGGVLSVWGRGTGAADEIGLAVFFEPSDFAGTEETETDRWVKLTGGLGGPGSSGVEKTYWVLSGWVKGLGAPAYPAAKNWAAKAGDVGRQVRGRVKVSYKAS
jgi:hypothetical protein